MDSHEWRRLASTERTQDAKWIIFFRCLMAVGISCRIKITIQSIEKNLKFIVILLSQCP